MNDKILDQINGKYKYALLTTFNYDLEYFDNQIFYKFFVNGIKDITVFADAEQLQESLNKQKTNLGIRYSVIPFRMKKSFHPKVILLLDDDKAKLIVGSLNLTEKGYSSNQEVFNSFEYSKDNQSNLNLIIEAYQFFNKLKDLAENYDEELFSKINDIPYLKRNDISGEIKLLNNLRESIYSQALRLINSPVKSIDIAVPYYDNDASALAFIEKDNINSNIKLYVQNEKSTFPEKLYESYKDKIFKFKKILCNECGNFYHGKVFRFTTDKESYILYGSANCTNAAFLKSLEEDGNVECDILERGSIHEFDEFFNQFEEDNSEFSSHPIIENKQIESINFVLENLIKEESIKCIIKYKEKCNNLQILINNKLSNECIVEYKDGKLVVIIPKNIVKELGNIFKLSIKDMDANIENSINCFYNDFESISNYRNADESDKNIAKKILFKNDFFINDVIDLMYQMPNNAADAKKVKDNKKIYLEQKSETEESQTDEEYIINEELLLEYKKKYDDDNLANKALHKIGNAYYGALRDIIEFGESNDNIKSNKIIPERVQDQNIVALNLEVTDEELEIFNRRKGKRIIRKIVNGIATDSYKEEVEYNDYKAYIGLINLFFDKYTDYRNDSEIRLSEDNKKDYLFDYSDVADSRFKLSSSLLDLFIDSKINIDNEKNDIIVMCFISIFQKLYSLEEYGIQDKYFKFNAEKMVEKLDILFNIRDTYAEYVRDALKIINTHKVIISEGLAIGEIESLFKYKSLKRILDLTNFKENHEVMRDEDDNITLSVKTNETIAFVKIRLELLKNELNKYFKEKHNLKDNVSTFTIEVENPDVNMNNFDPIMKITLIWNNNGFVKTKDTKLNKDVVEEWNKW